MAIFRSGRERTLVVEGTWQCPLRVEYRCTNEWPAFPNRFATFSESYALEIEARALGAMFRFEPLSTFTSWPANTSCSNSFTGVPYSYRQTLKVFEGTGLETTSTGVGSVTYTVGDLSVFDLDPAAGWSVSADVEEWFEVVDPIEDADVAGFPNYGGASVADGVTGRRIRFFERLKPGGEMVATLGGLVPLTQTVTLTQAHADALGDIVHGVDRKGRIFAENDLSILTMTGTVAGEGVTAPYVRSVAQSLFSAEAGYLLQIEKGLGESGESYAESFAAVPVRFDWKSSLFCFRDVYPGSLDVRVRPKLGSEEVHVASPSALAQFEQAWWSGFCVLDGVTMSPDGLDERVAVRNWLDGAGLGLAGEDASDWRMVFRGRIWVWRGLSHALETVLDDCSSVTGWSWGVGTTVVSVGGVLAVAAGSGGWLSRTFSPPVVSEGNRRLRIRVRSLGSGGLPLRVHFADKSWDLATGADGLWVERTIDLCNPDNLSLNPDEKTSRFPLDAGSQVQDSVHWGVSLIGELLIDGLLEGGQYEIDQIALFRSEVAMASLLPAYKTWIQRQEPDGTTVQPYFWSDVEGRVADLPGMVSAGGTYSWPSLSDLAVWIGGLGGWVLTAGGVPPDDYHGDWNPCQFAWGSGAVADGPVWNVGVNAVIEGVVDVKAQSLWDEVAAYGGAGDVWSVGGVFGGATRLWSAKFLRSAAWGLVLGDGGSVSGSDVRYLRDGTVDRGGDISDSLGRYETGTPWGVDPDEYAVSGAGVLTPLFLAQNRMRYRRVVHEVASGGSVSVDWHESGETIRARVDVNGSVWVGVRDGSGPYVESMTPLVADHVAVRFGTGRGLRSWLAYSRGGEVRLAYSDDLGGVWQMASVLATGVTGFPALSVHRDGRRFVYWVAGTQVDGVILDAAGTELSRAAAVRTGVEPVGLAVVASDRALGRTEIEMVTVEGGSVVSTVSTDGVTFG